MKALLALALLAAPVFASDSKELGIETEAEVEDQKPAKPVLKPVFEDQKPDAAAPPKKNPKTPVIVNVDKDESKETGSRKFKRTPLKPVRKTLLKPIKPVTGGRDEAKP